MQSADDGASRARLPCTVMHLCVTVVSGALPGRMNLGQEETCATHQGAGGPPSSSVVELVMSDSQTEKTLSRPPWKPS
jgi:hypothetical protein